MGGRFYEKRVTLSTESPEPKSADFHTVPRYRIETAEKSSSFEESCSVERGGAVVKEVDRPNEAPLTLSLQQLLALQASKLDGFLKV